MVARQKPLGLRTVFSSSVQTSPATTTAPPKPVEHPVRRENPPVAKPSPASGARNALKAAVEKKTATQPQNSPVPASDVAAVRTETFPSANAPSASASSSQPGELLDQILSDASPGAVATLHGVVRVSVRVQADPSGTVSDAAVDSPGPSKYFADLALQAARRWQFTSPDAGGRSIPREWLINLPFPPSRPKRHPSPTAPYSLPVNTATA